MTQFGLLTMNLPQKRPLSPEATIPAEDCTRDTFDQHANLSDRQFLSWALQTEARVRFEKLQGRAAGGNESSNDGRDTTLNSDYLIDVYPDIGVPVNKGILARERHAFARKSIPYLQTTKDPDSSFDTVTRLKFYQKQVKGLSKNKSYLPVPPNLLVFEIILEAYMGYRVPTFRSPDPSHPSAAIMGGAVTAALSSYRDPFVIKQFEDNVKDLEQALEYDDLEKYESTYEIIFHALHSHFLDGYQLDRSPFSLGDVDIFLQASPLTRSLASKLRIAFPREVRGIIGSFLGGCGLVHQDLQNFATGLCEDYLAPLFRDTGNTASEYPRCRPESSFCYALAANGLSFALGISEKDNNSFDQNNDTWPRTTQLIMLNEEADHVGGLMDFDISGASCAYNGLSVSITPRAAFSLKTLTQVVTPFVFEEKRNRTRIGKYFQRGFDAFVIDPYCLHDKQCYDPRQQYPMYVENVYEKEESTIHYGIKWTANALSSNERYEEICRRQGYLMQSRREGDLPHIFVCREGCHCDDEDEECRCHEFSRCYTVCLIEKSENHALEYFSKRDNWSEEFRQEVMSVPEEGRLACRRCRRDYGLQLVLDQVPSFIESVESVDDVLRGEVSYKHTLGWCGGFDPSFYCGGAFNSYYVGVKARSRHQLLMVLAAQQIIEEARYVRKHGSRQGYQPRFVYDDEIYYVFQEAAERNFVPSGRAPVGLNPERFIATCKGCQQWLHGCEFNVQYCEDCEELKPAAVDG